MDVLLRILALEVEELGHHEVPDVVVDRRAEEHDALLQEPGVDVERTLAAAGLLDDDGDEGVLHCCSSASTFSGAGLPSVAEGASSRTRFPSCVMWACSTRRSSAFVRMISPASVTI